MTNLLKIAPVYFVTGNHEYWSKKWHLLEPELSRIGVIILNDSTVEINNENILITGINDPAKFDGVFPDKSIIKNEIDSATNTYKENRNFKILLSHRAELFTEYNQFDLIMSGHTHGGQFTIPFIGGFISPNQGLFPKYDKGLYQKNNSTMIVSGGLGNSIIPIRLFNYPEVIIINLISSNN